MNLILYSITDNDNVINKTLGVGTVIPLRLKTKTDLLRPEMLLAAVPDVSYQSFNYAHIDTLNRFYFITSVEVVNRELWRLQLECDVIETYKTDILNSVARFKRNIKNGDYIDGSIDTSVIKSITKHDSNVTLTDNSTLILTTVGV